MALKQTLLDSTAQLLQQIPGMGTRSSQRFLLHLLQRRDTLLHPLTIALETLYQQVSSCVICFGLDVQSPCSVCTDSSRDTSMLCVVEDVASLWAMERSGRFKGLYHVLHGTLSAASGINPAVLHIPALIARLHETPAVHEVILALSATVDGQTTAHYIAKQLEDSSIMVSVLGHGIPIGGTLDYLDDGTLHAAIVSRKSLL